LEFALCDQRELYEKLLHYKEVKAILYSVTEELEKPEESDRTIRELKGTLSRRSEELGEMCQTSASK
jgi:hypothetical protein